MGSACNLCSWGVPSLLKAHCLRVRAHLGAAPKRRDLQGDTWPQELALLCQGIDP